MDTFTRNDLTQEQLKEILHYDPLTGVFTWRKSRPGVRSAIAGGKVQSGGTTSKSWYVGITINYVRYMAHRLAFLYMTGKHPSQIVDHEDHNGLHNAWSNLRLATPISNAQNKCKDVRNTSGHTGVSFTNGKYAASIGCNGNRKYLGAFMKLRDAVTARQKAEIEMGFHPNHGKDV